MDHGITYGTANGLEGYTDADWASDSETRRSLGAYVYLLYGGAVSWTSKRQQSIALSSCKVEYVAQTQAAKEVIWLTRLLSELDIGFGLPTKPVIIKADNQGAIALTKDPHFHSRTKALNSWGATATPSGGANRSSLLGECWNSWNSASAIMLGMYYK